MKVTVTGKNLAGDEVTVYVKPPTSKILGESKIKEAIAFGTALKEGVVLRAVLNSYLKTQGLWSDDSQKRVNEIRKELGEGEAQLARGAKTKDGNILTKQDAYKLAMRMRELRTEYFLITSVLTDYDKMTAEGSAENVGFEYLCYKCILNDEGNPLFNSVDEYKEKADEPYVEQAASELAKITNNFDKDWFKKLPEIKFLIKYKFMNEDARLINSEGKFITESGELIDQDYRRVNEDNQLVNEYGDLVDDKGNFLDFVDFE